MNIIETERLFLRELNTGDAEFILELINEPGWIKNIGDRGIREIEGAIEYIQKGPAASYEKNGFGLWLVGLKETNEPIGMCGLIKRETLADIDIGFAFLERFWGKGFAIEAASAVMDFARSNLGLKRIVAITVSENLGSIKVLEKLGMRFERMMLMPGETEELKLFAIEN